MVAGRRVRHLARRLHRSIDDLLDTIFRFSSQERVNEVHLELAAKVDSYLRFVEQRAQKEDLLEL